MLIKTNVTITDKKFKINNENVSEIVGAVNSPGVRVNILDMHTQKGVLAAKNTTNPKGIALLETQNGAGETESYIYETFLVINGKEYSLKDIKYTFTMNNDKLRIINNIDNTPYFNCKEYKFQKNQYTQIKVNNGVEKTKALTRQFNVLNIEEIVKSISFSCDFNKIPEGQEIKSLKWIGNPSYIEIGGKKVPNTDYNNYIEIDAATSTIFISYYPNKDSEILFSYRPSNNDDMGISFSREGNRIGFGEINYFFNQQDTSPTYGGNAPIKENEFNYIVVNLSKAIIYVNGVRVPMSSRQAKAFFANINTSELTSTNKIKIGHLDNVHEFSNAHISQIVCFNESFSNEIIKTITPEMINFIMSDNIQKFIPYSESKKSLPNVIHTIEVEPDDPYVPQAYIPPFTAYELTENATDITGKHTLEPHNVEFTTDGKYACAKFTGGVMGANTYNNGIHIPGDKIKNLKEFTFACKAKGTGVLFQTDYFGDAVDAQATGWGLFTWMIDKAIAADKKITINFDEPDDSKWHTWIFTVNHYGEAAVYINSKLIASGSIKGKPYYNGQFYANTGTNIGASYDAGFTGFIKNVVIMEKALNSEEVSLLNTIVSKTPKRFLKPDDQYVVPFKNSFKKYFPYTCYPWLEGLQSCVSKERNLKVNGNQNITFDSKDFKGLFFDGSFSVSTNSNYMSQMKSFSVMMEITMNDFGSRNSDGSQIQPFFVKDKFKVMAYNEGFPSKFSLYDGDYEINSDIDLADGKTHLLYFVHEDGVKNILYIDNQLIGTSKASKLFNSDILIGDYVFKVNGNPVHNMLESTYIRNLAIKEGEASVEDLEKVLNDQKKYCGLGEKLLLELLGKDNKLDVSKIKTDDKVFPYQIRICGDDVLKYIPTDPKEESYTIKFVTKDNVVELYINDVKAAEFDSKFFNQELTLLAGNTKYIVGADDTDSLNALLQAAEEI